jgi:membrane protein implicated in regulation of membrane protease activity
LVLLVLVMLLLLLLLLVLLLMLLLLVSTLLVLLWPRHYRRLLCKWTVSQKRQGTRDTTFGLF